MILPNRSPESKQMLQGLAHLAGHALKTEQGKQAIKAAAGTAVAAVTAFPVLLPLVAVGSVAAAIWWWSKD